MITPILACLLGVTSAAAEPAPKISGSTSSTASPKTSERASHSPSVAITPDPVERRTDPPPKLDPTWDLDGWYVWLGPVGAASRVREDWDTTFGGDLSILRVREGEALGAVGVSVGASKWAARGGGRIWIDGVAGTKLGRMVGVSAGPLLEFAELAHPRLGGSVGVWAFVGVTPFARVGYVDELGGFAEFGLHVALPIYRTRR